MSGWKEVAADIEAAGKSINDIAQSMGGWKTIVEGLIALKLAGWVVGVTGSLRTLFALSPPAWVRLPVNASSEGSTAPSSTIRPTRDGKSPA